MAAAQRTEPRGKKHNYIPALAIGAAPDPARANPPDEPYSQEDQEIVEERLRSLGYL